MKSFFKFIRTAFHMSVLRRHSLFAKLCMGILFLLLLPLLICAFPFIARKMKHLRNEEHISEYIYPMF